MLIVFPLRESDIFSLRRARVTASDRSGLHCFGGECAVGSIFPDKRRGEAAANARCAYSPTAFSRRAAVHG
jgi:hypothetical protein